MKWDAEGTIDLRWAGNFCFEIDDYFHMSFGQFAGIFEGAVLKGLMLGGFWHLFFYGWKMLLISLEIILDNKIVEFGSDKKVWELSIVPSGCLILK